MKRAFCTLYAGCLLTAALSVYGGVFVDNFDDGVPNGWDFVLGDWEIEDGALALLDTPPQAGVAAIAVLDSPWIAADSVVTFTVRHHEDSDGTERPMLYFRMKDEDSGYAFRIRGDEQHLNIGRIEAGIWEDIRGDIVDVMEFDEPFEIRLEIEGNFVFIYYNGELRLRIGDPDERFAEGRIGLGGEEITNPIYFDNLRIEGDGVTQFAADLLPVDPHGRLATMWGLIKR